MNQTKRLALVLASGIGAAALAYAVYKILIESKPKKKIEFAKIEESREKKWLQEQKKKRKAEVEKSVAPTPPRSAEEITCQSTQNDNTRISAASPTPSVKSVESKTPVAKVVSEPKEVQTAVPKSVSTALSNPTSPAKGVSRANEIKSATPLSQYATAATNSPASGVSTATTPSNVQSKYVVTNMNTPAKGINTATEMKTPAKTTSISAATIIGPPSSEGSVPGSTSSGAETTTPLSENSKGSKRIRRHSKRQQKRNSQRMALKLENKENSKDQAEDELLKANKEDSSATVVPKYCECRNLEIDSTKDTENLFDPKIKYKSNYKKTEVEYYPYKSMDLLTTEGGASELSREVWDVSTLVRRPTSYLTPFQAILDAQDYAAQHAEVMDNLIKYGDDE